MTITVTPRLTLQPRSASNRTIKVNTTLEHYKQQARQNLKSPEGDWLKRQRETEAEDQS